MPKAAEFTDEQLAEIERRAEAASPGPWQAFVEGRDHTSGDTIIRMGAFDGSHPDMYISTCDDSGNPNRVSDADWDFVAHARQDVPRLVAEVRRLQAVVSMSDEPDD